MATYAVLDLPQQNAVAITNRESGVTTVMSVAQARDLAMCLNTTLGWVIVRKSTNVSDCFPRR